MLLIDEVDVIYHQLKRWVRTYHFDDDRGVFASINSIEDSAKATGADPVADNVTTFENVGNPVALILKLKEDFIVLVQCCFDHRHVSVSPYLTNAIKQ